MEPSSSNESKAPADPRQKLWKLLDRLAMGGLGLGLALYVLPAGKQGLRIAFFLTFVFTIFHIVTSHARKPEKS